MIDFERLFFSSIGRSNSKARKWLILHFLLESEVSGQPRKYGVQ